MDKSSEQTFWSKFSVLDSLKYSLLWTLLGQHQKQSRCCHTQPEWRDLCLRVCVFRMNLNAAVEHLSCPPLSSLRAFDVELLYIAQCFKIPIAEVAVNWTEIEGRFFMEYVVMCPPTLTLICASINICCMCCQVSDRLIITYCHWLVVLITAYCRCLECLTVMKWTYLSLLSTAVINSSLRELLHPSSVNGQISTVCPMKASLEN